MTRTRPEAVPLFHTPRHPTRETTGRRKAGVARALGTPFIPWQRDLGDVWGEIDPTTGEYWYDTLVLLGLRQTGKTTFVRADLTETALYRKRALIRYTAQTRQDGLLRLEHDFYEPIRDSALGLFLDDRIGSKRRGTPGWWAKTGAEHIRFRNGSRWETGAVKSTSGHGPTLHKGGIDEAFAHRDAAIEQAMRPAMQTVAGSQLLIASAAGDTTSTYLAGKRKAEVARFGSLVAQHGPLGPTRSRTMFVEYALPRDADPTDPESWWRCHPGLGWLTTEEKLAAALEAADADPWEFYRPYLGWWKDTSRETWVIPEASLDACKVDDPDAPDWIGAPVYAVDTSPDRSMSSVGLAGRSPEAAAWVEVARRDHGTAWVVPVLERLRSDLGGTLVVIDGAGPAATHETALTKAGFTVVLASTREVNVACGGIYDDVVTGDLRHGGDPEIYESVKAARWIPSGDSRRFGRTRSLDDITALYAVTLARHGLLTRAPADYDPAASVIGAAKETP
ncbi:hypothetical protein [Sanguibacter sp. HDW7]|uniref:hypothetical protein n=1 Tax=Sanguibacter sp. HDW7 TaxID=2714931 RepID=UPI00140799E7|nr:hypothetical protein [Sanguibacter sp. HDW7]QIK83101.1 hypothetical protein G7063_05265 [Sanguibacter sp. HDW7]